MHDRPLQHGTSSCLMVAILAPNCRFLLSSVSNQTALASTSNTSAPVVQRANLTDSNQVALFYHPVCSALRSPPLIATAWGRPFISCREIILGECINDGNSAARCFSNLMHVYFKRHGFATSQVLAYFFHFPHVRASFLQFQGPALLKGFSHGRSAYENLSFGKDNWNVGNPQWLSRKKKTTLTWQMTDFGTDKWPTSELINYRLQDWRMTDFKNRLNVLSVSGHGTSCLPFSAFLLHGVPWCSLT